MALITGLANFPLSWIGNSVLPDTLKPRPFFLGTLWKGQIANIQGINPVNTSTDLRKILRSEPPITFESESPFLRFSGSAKLNGSITAQANGNITGLSVFDSRFQSLAGTYDLSLDDIIIRDICRSGAGRFNTDILSQNFSRWQWTGPVLSGPISCTDGYITADLSGSDAMQTITAKLRVEIEGQYRASAKVVTSDPRAEFVLTLFGFEKTSQGYSLAEAGAWR